MPPIFKALASTGAWVLFIFAWIIGISIFIQGIIIGELYGSEPPSMEIWAGSAVALAFAVGSIVVMILRQKME
jgi:cytochrome b subunit of formate dehydrogenase